MTQIDVKLQLQLCYNFIVLASSKTQRIQT